MQSQVLIVGAGPVGLTLAIDLAWRGIAVIVAETRAARRAAERQVQPRLGALDGDLPPPRRRQALRDAGLPPDYPNDVAYRTTMHRARAVAHPHPCAARPLHRQERPGQLVADAGAAAPHQPDLPRADPVRACRGDAAACASSTACAIDELHAGCRRRARQRHRPGDGARMQFRATTWSAATAAARPSQGHRRQALGHRRGRARAVHLLPRARPAGRAGTSLPGRPSR